MIEVIRTYPYDGSSMGWKEKIYDFMTEVFEIAGIGPTFGNIAISLEAGAPGALPQLNVSSNGVTSNVFYSTDFIANYKYLDENTGNSRSGGSGNVLNADSTAGSTVTMSTMIYGKPGEFVLIRSGMFGINFSSGLIFMNIPNTSSTYIGIQTSNRDTGLSVYGSNALLNTFAFSPGITVNSAIFDPAGTSSVVLLPYVPAKCNGNIINGLFISKYNGFFSPQGQGSPIGDAASVTTMNEGSFSINGHHFTTSVIYNRYQESASSSSTVMQLTLEDLYTDGG